MMPHCWSLANCKVDNIRHEFEMGSLMHALLLSLLLIRWQSTYVSIVNFAVLRFVMIRIVYLTSDLGLLVYLNNGSNICYVIFY